MRLRWLTFSHISLPLIASLVTQTPLSACEIRDIQLFFLQVLLTFAEQFSSVWIRFLIRSYLICIFCEVCSYCRPILIFLYNFHSMFFVNPLPVSFVDFLWINFKRFNKWKCLCLLLEERGFEVKSSTTNILK